MQRRRQLLLLIALLAWAHDAPAAGGVLDGKLADSALAEFSQQPDRQVQTRRLDSHLADRALADLPWSPPARAPQKQRSAFAELQDGLRDVPPTAGRRTTGKSTADLTSVLANLKNEALTRADRRPHIVTRHAAITAAPAVPALKPAMAPPKSAPVAAAALPPQPAAVVPAVRRVVPPPEPQRVTTGVLTGLRLLPPDQTLRKAAPAIVAVAAPAAASLEPKTPAAVQQQPASPAAESSAPNLAATPAPNASIIIEVLPPPPAAAPPTATSAPALSDKLTAAAPAKNRPPQAFRSSQPPDKMPLFITARSGETVKLAPAPAPQASKTLADEALAAYTAVTPPLPSEQPLRFDGREINLAVNPPDEGRANAPKAADQPAAVTKADVNSTDKKAEDDALKKKASEVAGEVVPLTGDNATTDVRQELWKEWSEKVILLEQENKALRGELANTKADPLQDIRVDAVAKIKEQVLRERIIELEKEVLEAQNKAREAALNEAAKKAADGALVPPPGAKDLPIKP